MPNVLLVTEVTQARDSGVYWWKAPFLTINQIFLSLIYHILRQD